MSNQKEFTTTIRVRYAETDQMGYVYYGRYPEYFEVARVEAIRELGMSYKMLEEQGYMLPVAKLEIKYMKPIVYDEKIELRSSVRLVGKSFIRFETEVFKENKELATTGIVTLCFVDSVSRKPVEHPQELVSNLA